MYRIRLELEGHQVATAADGETGLSMALDSTPDLVLLDLDLPRLDGIGVLQRLRAEPKGRRMPVVILSNSDDPDSVSRAGQLGALEYLVKSHTSPTAVAEVVERVVAAGPEPAAMSLDDAPPQEDARPDGAQPRILVVDDNPAKLAALEAVLSSLGAEVVTAASSGAGLRRLLGEDFAVALLDIRMSDLDGYDLAEAVKRQKGRSSPAIIFVTAFEASEVDVVRAYSMGAVDYIYSSSMAPEIIRARVSVLLDDYKKRHHADTGPSAHRGTPLALTTLGSPRGRLVSVGQAARLVGGSEATLRRWAHEGWISDLSLPGAPRRLVDLREIVLVMGLRFSLREISPQVASVLGLPTDGAIPTRDPCLAAAARVARVLRRPRRAVAESVTLLHRHGYSCEEIGTALSRIERMAEAAAPGA